MVVSDSISHEGWGGVEEVVMQAVVLKVATVGIHYVNKD